MSTRQETHDYFRALDLTRGWTYAELMEEWNCVRDTVRSRIKAGKRAGYEVKLKKCKTKGRKPNRNYTRSIKLHRDYVYKDELGDPSLPECPNCIQAKRHGSNGEVVHLFDEGDGVLYCPCCAWFPEKEVMPR